jgi:YVTN family beta-propeller protein
MAAFAASAGASTAYVTSLGERSVSVINTATNTVSPTKIAVGSLPIAVAITPDGKTAYVANSGSESVSVINAETNQASPMTIRVENGPQAIAITPDGKTAYVVNRDSESVSVIDTRTNVVEAVPGGEAIKVGSSPRAIAITPDGKTAYVANVGSGSVSVIDTQTNQASLMSIPVGTSPEGIAITPDGKTAYVTNSGDGNVSMINTQTNVASPTTIRVGGAPVGIAITPDQAPHATFSAARARPGVPVAFDASASKDPDGSIIADAWAFGDGQTLSAGPSVSHAYGAPGTYQATLSATDNEGCSTAPILATGQRCLGSPSLASQIQTVTVAYPGVKVKCPKSAKHGGCKIKLQVVSKRRKGKAESALAKVKLKAGHAAIVSLKPKAAFAAGLAVAEKVLVKETVTVNGSKRTSLRELKIVQ